MKPLLEKEYEDIFSPKTMASLKKKSGESAEKMLGGKSLGQVMRTSMTLLNDVILAEKEYRDELEMLAVQMAKDAYPILDYNNIKIDAKIVDLSQLDMPMGDNDEDNNPASPDFGEDDPEKLKAKRRIINGITQGASVRGSFWFLLFRDYLDQLDPALVEKYNKLMNLVFGVYDDENAIAMMLAALAQGAKIEGGESKMDYDEENDQFVIKARATCFPMLVHEIIKGLYEIIGSEGASLDPQKAQAVINQIDKVGNEPRDLQYGKFIYDAINKVYEQSNMDDSRVRDLLLVELYRLSDNEFLSFVENAINDELSSQQRQWATNTMKDIERDLKRDDADISESNEIFINMKQSDLREIVRRVVNEKKLTAAEKRKKEDIVKGMKKSFKGDKEAMYAIATAKAKKVAEARVTPVGIPSRKEDIKDTNIKEGSDHEVSMAVSSLEAIAKAIVELRQKLGNQERNIPSWIQDHIAKAENYIEQAAQGFHELKMEEKDPLDVVVSEKKGKDLDGDGDIDSDDYLKARSIAIQKAKAIGEARSVATDFQLSSKQFDLLKNSGAKVNTAKEELYLPDLVKIELDKNRTDPNADLKKEFFLTVPPSDEYIVNNLIVGIKNSLKNTVKIGDKVYWVLKGHFTKKGNFNFPNPTRSNKKA